MTATSQHKGAIYLLRGSDLESEDAGSIDLSMRVVIAAPRWRNTLARRAIQATVSRYAPGSIREEVMTDQPADSSRRDFVTAAAVTMAAAAGAASGAQAQTPSNLRFSNPSGMSKPAAYSHVVEVNGPHRTVYLAGQTGVDASSKVAEGFRAQAVQVMENIIWSRSR